MPGRGKRKRGPKGLQEKASLPRYAGFNTQLQGDKNEMREPSTMKGLRWGFNLMWEHAEAEMEKHNIPRPDTFDKKNHHGGKLWGWPRECNMTDNKAKRIFYACYKTGNMTEPMLRAVRKTLAYAYELKGGEPLQNWPSIKGVWQTFKLCNLPKSEMSQKPELIPTPQQLKRAFTTEWNPDCPMVFAVWLVGLIAAFDSFVNGLRSNEDISRVKNSPRHVYNWDAGWECSEFDGGRAKLCGNKKGTREWWVWRVCLCPGGRHIRPPHNFKETINKAGNPTVNIKWCTCCPLAALELLWSYPGPRRCYPKWLTKSGTFKKQNEGDVIQLALQWMLAQGVTEVGFDTNSGRKSLANWCEFLHVPYAESFYIHGDHPDVWRDSYQPTIPTVKKGNNRKQGRNPDECTKALRRFGGYLGRGRQLKPQLNRHERYLHHFLQTVDKGDLADKIRRDLPSDDEGEGKMGDN